MKKVILLVLAWVILISISCKKEEPPTTTTTTTNTTITPTPPIEYITQVSFQQVSGGYYRGVELNGVELATLTFTSKQGDTIKVYAGNLCSWDTQTGVQSCEYVGATIYLEGLEAYNYGCRCSALEFEYIVE